MSDSGKKRTPKWLAKIADYMAPHPLDRSTLFEQYEPPQASSPPITDEAPPPLPGPVAVSPAPEPPKRHTVSDEPLNPPLIRKSMKLLDAGPEQCSSDFYGYLFAAWPALRSMFPPQMSHQNERLWGALVRIVEMLEDPDGLADYLAQLGRDHLKYGVQPEHYAAVGQALLRTLRRHVPAWTDDEEAAWTAAYDTAAALMIEGAEAIQGPAWWDGRVVRHERRTDSTAVLTVKTREPLPYSGGQYLTVQTGKWQRVWRPYSIASAPRGDGTELDLHVRAVPGGWVSTALVKDTRLNDQVWLGPALGSMTPAAANGHDIVAVAGGTGLAPIKALAEHVLHRDEDAMAAGEGMRRMIHLFFGARSPRDLYAMPELRELERAYPWLQVIPVVSGDGRFSGERGNVAEVAAGWHDWTSQAAFVAGPAVMVEQASRSLVAAGLRRVHYDSAELGVPGV